MPLEGPAGFPADDAVRTRRGTSVETGVHRDVTVRPRLRSDAS